MLRETKMRERERAREVAVRGELTFSLLLCEVARLPHMQSCTRLKKSINRQKDCLVQHNDFAKLPISGLG